MGRPPVIPAETKERTVLAVLAGKVTIIEAARRERVSEQSVGRWKATFVEAGRAALAGGEPRPTNRTQQLEAELTAVTQELRRAQLEVEVWKASAGGLLGPSTTSR